MLRESSLLSTLVFLTLTVACGAGEETDGDGDGLEPSSGGSRSDEPSEGPGGTGPTDVPASGGDSSTGGRNGVGGGSDPGLGGLGGASLGGAGSGGSPPLAPQDEICSKDGWCWMAPLPHGHSFRAMAERAGHLWAVGEGGVVVHQEGDDFSTWHLPGYPILYDVAFVGDRVWIAGEGGLLLESTGTEFQEIDLGVEDDLLAIRAFAPNDVWVGGGPSLFHHDGSDWANQSSGVSSVVSIGGPSSTDLYVGGFGPAGAMRHYDGMTWEYETDLLIRVSGTRAFTDIEIHDSKLHVSSDHTDGYLWVKDGDSWSHLATGFPGPIHDRGCRNGSLGRWGSGTHVGGRLDDHGTHRFPAL